MCHDMAPKVESREVCHGVTPEAESRGMCHGMIRQADLREVCHSMIPEAASRSEVTVQLLLTSPGRWQERGLCWFPAHGRCLHGWDPCGCVFLMICNCHQTG